MNNDKLIENVQEQAVASWINYLNQVRLERLMDVLTRENINLDNAMSTLNETLDIISREIVDNGLGRGGLRGMHGFIAEIAECGIGNARSQIEGKMPIYEWINDNGPEDIRRGATLIQQKFVNSGNHLSLRAISNHFERYPDFVNRGGIYQIPSDHYDRIKELLSISKEEAYKMPTSTGDFSFKQWKEVNEFFDNGKIGLESIEPSLLDYESVQRGAYKDTIKEEAGKLRKNNQKRRDQAYQESKPSLKEGASATAVSMAIEAGMAFILAISQKRREGKDFKDFDVDDWKDIASDSGIGAIKGGVRGAGVYFLSNYTATPSAVASAFITATIGIAEQANRYRKGELDELEFIESSEIVCLEASISAITALLGQVIIPIPILGAVIGSTVGTMMYQIIKDNSLSKEQVIVEKYLQDIADLDVELQVQYDSFIKELSENVKFFMCILDSAFAPDIRIAFKGSIEMARELGISDKDLLTNKEEIRAYFED